VEGELGFQLDEFLTGLEGVGFAGVVGVEHEGELILLRGYGLAERETGRRVTPDTVFTVGSITKQFTGAAILALQDDGKLSVQDPLTKYFDDVPEDKRTLTLHHLLTHTSGLTDPRAGDFDPRATAAWVLDQAFGAALESEPGARYAYRNVNFSLLGMIVEKVSGEGYEAFLQRRLFAPAGMKHTGYLAPRYAPEELAVGYKAGERWGTVLERTMLADGPCWTLRANGGIHSTVGDMLRWHHALQEDRVLSAAAHELLETPWVSEVGSSFYGYGWSIDRSPGGGKLVAHDGGNSVFFADFLRFVDEGHCIFLATGVGSSVRPSLAYDLAAILYGRSPRRAPETLARDHAWLERYAGRYPLDEGSFLEVRNLGDRLGLSGSGAEALELLLAPEELEHLERARALTGAVCGGDDDALLAVYAGFQTPASVRDELAGARAQWSRRLGSYQGPGTGTVRMTGRETNALVEARFEHGRAWFSTLWGPDGHVQGFQCLDEAPFEGLPCRELFPFAPDEFQAYDDRTGVGPTLRFELDDDGRPTALGWGQPELWIQRE